MKTIAIVGTSGCGKSTLARKLEEALEIEAIDLDDYYWLPGWNKRDSEEFAKIVGRIISQDSWIITGNYSKFREAIWDRADTIIWLDYSLFRCFYWGLRRAIRNIVYEEKFCGGNYETISRAFFSKESILLWILSTFWRRKKSYSMLFKSYESKKLLRFYDPESAKYWLGSF